MSKSERPIHDKMKMVNKGTGEAVYFNPITKRGKEARIIQGIGSTVVIGRDRQKKKSRTFRACLIL